MIRMGNDLLGDAVAVLRICIGTPIAKSMIGDALHLDRQISLLLMEEGQTIGDEILQVT